MTVIAWDGETLAADRLAHSEGLRNTVCKLRAVRDGIIGFSGDLTACLEFVAWYEAGAIPSEYPAYMRDTKECPVNALLIREGRIFKFDCTPFPCEFHDKRMVIGSGRDFALAAMHLGSSAIKAVQITNELCTTCGNGVDWMRLDGSHGTIVDGGS